MADAQGVKIEQSSKHLVGVALEVQGSRGRVHFKHFEEVGVEGLHDDVEVLMPALVSGEGAKDLDHVGTVQHLYYLQLPCFVLLVLLDPLDCYF